MIRKKNSKKKRIISLVVMTIFFGSAIVIFYRGFIAPKGGSATPSNVVSSGDSAPPAQANIVPVVKSNGLPLLDNPLFAERISVEGFAAPEQQAVFVEHPDKLSPATRVEALNVGTGTDIVIRWNDPQDTRAEQIAIYRSETPEEVGARLALLSLGTQVYRDSTAILGVTYYYFVLPISGTISSPSVFPTEVTTTDTVAPPPPLDVQVFVTDSGYVQVTWRPSLMEKPSHYEIYRSQEQGVIGNPIVIGYESDKTSYEDRSVTPGLSFYYTVVAVDAAGNKSTPLTADPTVGNQFPFGR